MTMQLEQIIPSFLSLSDEDKVEAVRTIRHIKYVLKPDVRKRKKKQESKEAATSAKKSKATVTNAIQGITKKQALELLKQLKTI